MAPKQRKCRECGKPFASPRREALFCSGACRKSHSNRRMTRGAEIYDLAMEWRFARGAAEERETLSHLCAILGRFNDDDKSHGRKSWSPSARLANVVQSRVGR